MQTWQPGCNAIVLANARQRSGEAAGLANFWHCLPSSTVGVMVSKQADKLVFSPDLAILLRECKGTCSKKSPTELLLIV